MKSISLILRNGSLVISASLVTVFHGCLHDGHAVLRRENRFRFDPLKVLIASGFPHVEAHFCLRAN